MPTKTPAQLADLVIRSKAYGKPQLQDLASRTGERVGARVEPCGGTASWSFDAQKRKHVVTLDPNYTATINTTPYRGRNGRHSQKSQCEYGAAMIRHEKWHGILTDRDIPAVAQYAASLGIPFSAVNIAEDLRIEHQARSAEGKPFCWILWNLYPEENGSMWNVSQPLRWLALSTMAENPSTTRWNWTGKEEVERIVGGKPDGKGKRDPEEVLAEFCEAISVAGSTLQVVDLLADLFATFPTAKRDPKDVGGLPERVAGVGYCDKQAQGDSDTTQRADSIAQKLDGLDPVTRGKFEGFAVKPSRRGLKRIDLSRVKAIADRLSSLLGKLDAPPTRVSQSGSRIHVPNVARGESSAFRTNGKSGGKRKVVLICDQSNSMNASWRNHGAAFAGAVLTLAQRGVIDARVILTGQTEYCELPKNFPVELLGITACNHGADSVSDTMRANRAAIREADTTIVYTDGYLTNGNVSKGEWRSGGMDVVGVAVNDANAGDTTEKIHGALLQHFDRGFVADTGPSLASAIVQYIGRRPKR